MAAGPVRRCDQILDDELLNQRGTVIEIDHPVVGKRRQLGLPWRMTVGVSFRTDSYVREAGTAGCTGIMLHSAKPIPAY